MSDEAIPRRDRPAVVPAVIENTRKQFEYILDVAANPAFGEQSEAIKALVIVAVDHVAAACNAITAARSERWDICSEQRGHARENLECLVEAFEALERSVQRSETLRWMAALARSK